MKGSTKFLVTVLALCGSPWAMAQTIASYAYVCNSCTPSQTLDDARYGAAGDYYIYDFTQNQLTHWHVTGSDRNVVPRPGLTPQITPRRHISLIANTAQDMKIFNDARAVYNANGGTEVYGDPILITVSGLPSATMFHPSASVGYMRPMHGAGEPYDAFDMVESPAIRGQVLQQTQQEHRFSRGLQGFMNNLFNDAAQVVGITTPIHAFIPLHFADGSSCLIQWNGSDTTWVYVKGSSKDAVGNPIAENSIDAAGGHNSELTYIFPAGETGSIAGQKQLQHLNNLGIYIPSYSYGGSWQIRCVSSPGAATACHAFPN